MYVKRESEPVEKWTGEKRYILTCPLSNFRSLAQLLDAAGGEEAVAMFAERASTPERGFPGDPVSAGVNAAIRAVVDTASVKTLSRKWEENRALPGAGFSARRRMGAFDGRSVEQITKQLTRQHAGSPFDL